MKQPTDTQRTDAFYPNHEAAIASPTHAAKRSSGLKALATGLWKTAWERHPKISDEFFIAHEALEVASVQMQKLEAEVERLKMRADALDNITFDQADRLNECEANLRRAIEIAESWRDDFRVLAGYSVSAEARDEIDQLKATISEPNSLQSKPPAT